MHGTHLFNSIGVGKAPSPVHVRHPDFLTSVATSRLRLETAVAGPTVPLLLHFAVLLQLTFELGRVRVRHFPSALLQADFEDVVREIALDFTADVHDIETEDCMARGRETRRPHGSMGKDTR